MFLTSNEWEVSCTVLLGTLKKNCINYIYLRDFIFNELGFQVFEDHELASNNDIILNFF